MLTILGALFIIYFGFKFLGKLAGTLLAFAIIWFVAKWLLLAVVAYGLYVGIGWIYLTVKEKRGAHD